MKDKPKPASFRAAIYARVSSEQQVQQSTIASQVAALRERLHADGLVLEDDLCFRDDGYSGSTLVRPGLERLRDVAWTGGFSRLYVHSPDRLARKYAWQVLLVLKQAKAPRLSTPAAAVCCRDTVSGLLPRRVAL